MNNICQIKIIYIYYNGFSNTEKLDILLKDSFNVPSTNENIAWYLETNANYSTWTNGSDILLDTFATSNVWASSTNLYLQQK